MVKENKKEEKICLFFASDYHFEMISLPYINENLRKENNVIVMTENNLEETIYKLLSNINLTEEDKEKIIEIDWKNDDVNKFKKIKNLNKNGKKTVVFIKGNENYINTINNNIRNWIQNNDVKIVDCYDINQVFEDVSNITKKYNKVLSTSGIEKLL